jgi:hypothetical protein
MLNSFRAFRVTNSRAINIALLRTFLLRIWPTKLYSPAPCATYYFSRLFSAAVALWLPLNPAQKLRPIARAG